MKVEELAAQDTIRLFTLAWAAYVRDNTSVLFDF